MSQITKLKGSLSDSDLSTLRTAVLIPCHNEAPVIATVIHDFRTALPWARIYVYDNNSTDSTAARAQEAGAIVRRESMQGKGYVVCRMFSDVDADLYVLVDGDDTYCAASAPELLRHLVIERLDMVSAARIGDTRDVYRRGHRFGNRMLTGMVAGLFGNRFRDMLTGYRVFSRRFVKSFPALSAGFEIETQLTVHALDMQMRVAEVETPYRERPEGSYSKLRTVRDGWRIIKTIGVLFKDERPLAFFSACFGVLALGAMGLAWPIFAEFTRTGLVPRFPTAILATGMMLLAFLSLASGLILDTVAHGRRELKRLHYLATPPLPAMDSAFEDVS